MVVAVVDAEGREMTDDASDDDDMSMSASRVVAGESMNGPTVAHGLAAVTVCLMSMSRWA